jgi:hypothetical protein
MRAAHASSCFFCNAARPVRPRLVSYKVVFACRLSVVLSTANTNAKLKNQQQPIQLLTQCTRVRVSNLATVALPGGQGASKATRKSIKTNTAIIIILPLALQAVQAMLMRGFASTHTAIPGVQHWCTTLVAACRCCSGTLPCVLCQPHLYSAARVAVGQQGRSSIYSEGKVKVRSGPYPKHIHAHDIVKTYMPGLYERKVRQRRACGPLHVACVTKHAASAKGGCLADC